MSEEACINFDRCGNFVREGLTMCPQCLDEARRRQRKFYEENPLATVTDYSDHLEQLGHVM